VGLAARPQPVAVPPLQRRFGDQVKHALHRIRKLAAEEKALGTARLRALAEQVIQACIVRNHPGGELQVATR